MRYPSNNRHTAILLSFSLAAWTAVSAQTASLGLQPYLQDIRTDRVTILWTTLDSAGSGEVRYSADGINWPSATSQVGALTPADTALPYMEFEHRVNITGLSPDTEYVYEVYLDGANMTPASSSQNQLRFRTPGSSKFRFLVLGDSGDGAPVQGSLGALMRADLPAFVMHVGDLAYEDGSFLQLQEFYFNVYRAMMSRMAWFPVPGNHDYQTRTAFPYRTLMAVPSNDVPEEGHGLYYSFDWGQVHFVALDSNLPLILAAGGQGAMLQWLEQDLRNTRSRWRVAFFHHTPFPISHHVGDPNCVLAQTLITPILERYGVQLVLNGHEHLYMRTKPRIGGNFQDSGAGTVYITTGGGGSALHPVEWQPFELVAVSAPEYLRIDVDDSQVRVQAVGMQGEIIDDFTLSSDNTLSAMVRAAHGAR